MGGGRIDQEQVTVILVLIVNSCHTWIDDDAGKRMQQFIACLLLLWHAWAWQLAVL